MKMKLQQEQASTYIPVTRQELRMYMDAELVSCMSDSEVSMIFDLWELRNMIKAVKKGVPYVPSRHPHDRGETP